MTDRLSDEQLAYQAKGGCARSFDQLVYRFQVPLLHFLQQRVGSTDAEDLTQDTFVCAYEHLNRYRNKWPFRTWLFTIARHLSANHLRRFGRRMRPVTHGDSVLEQEPGTLPDPVAAVMEMESRNRLWDLATDVLNEEQVCCLWLHYVEQMPSREIARVLGRSRVAIKAIMFRARKKMLPWVKRLDLGDEPDSEPETERLKEPTLFGHVRVNHVETS